MAVDPIQPSLLVASETASPALDTLPEVCSACRGCPLAETRQQVVISRGDPTARLMVIGEGPGAQEDASGRPFVGRAGQLLDQMLASVGLDSERDAYVCNVVKCRPPDNRKPTAKEMAACAPWLAVQIAAVNPPIILVAGATALEGVLGLKGGISRLRGQWHPWQGRWVMPVFAGKTSRPSCAVSVSWCACALCVSVDAAKGRRPRHNDPAPCPADVCVPAPWH